MTMRTAVHIHDLSFAPFISETTIQTRLKELASQLDTDYAGKDPIFLAVLNGAFMFASDLFKLLNCQPELTFVKVSSYVGTQSSGRVDELIGLQTALKGRHVIIIEDILDTGVTMDKIFTLLHAEQPASLAICANVGGLKRACANFIAVAITALFLETIQPIRAPHIL